MAQISDDIEGVRKIWLTNVQRVALLSVPSSIGIVFVARPLVEVMLGDAWTPAILPLQILAVNGILQTFSATSGDVFQALNRAHYRVYVEVAHFVLVIPALVVGAHVHGIAGVAAAVVFVNLATGVPVLGVLMRMLKVSPAELLAAISRPATGWALMIGALSAALVVLRHVSPLAALVSLLVVGIGLYTAGIALFARDLVRSMWLSLRGVS